MLYFKGAWEGRPDTAATAAARVLRTWQMMPQETRAYGPWGVRRMADGAGHTVFTPLNDPMDPAEIERAVVAETTFMNKGPRTAPGVYAAFRRLSHVETAGDTVIEAAFSVRAGFAAPRRDNLLVDVNSDTDPDAVRGYCTALVRAWAPTHLALTSFEISRAQGHRSPQADVGWLTYLADGVSLDHAAVPEEVRIRDADGGCYLELPGSPTDPDASAVAAVRRALGYSA